jgi:hypothetical protein
MKRFALNMMVVACLRLTAFAQGLPRGEVFGGLSVIRFTQATPVGWQASATSNISRMFSLVADVGGQYKYDGTHPYQYLFGPRINVRRDKVTSIIQNDAASKIAMNSRA